MGLLKDSDKVAIKKAFEELSSPVKLINFTQETECAYCRETNEIIREVAGLSDKITAETYDFVKDQEAVGKFKIDKIPATVVMGENDNGIRFFGIPSGYEFATLLDDIKMVSSGQSGLSQSTQDILKKLGKPLHLQVFVTPT